MSPEFWLNLFDAAIVLGVAIPALVMARRVQNQRLRSLSTLLAAFFVVHGLYHGFAVLSAAFETSYGTGTLGFLSEGVTEPFSYAILLAFSVLLYRLGVL
jgi:hypothetical protein